VGRWNDEYAVKPESIKYLAYNNNMFRAVFLDRDGVLIENRSDYVRDWSHVAILPFAIDALSNLHKEGFKIIIVTNQSAVGRGIMTLETASEINNRLTNTIKQNGGWIDAVYMCPHAPQDNCNCRKPQPGLLLQAARELSLDLGSSWMVGDAWSDVLAGQSAGLHETIIVRTGRGSSQLVSPRPIGVQPFLISDDLFSASKTITDFMKKNP
jgi:D-glycero-D-manno-heptose 1,7-bisphosphate phosphatase